MFLTIGHDHYLEDVESKADWQLDDPVVSGE